MRTAFAILLLLLAAAPVLSAPVRLARTDDQRVAPSFPDVGATVIARRGIFDILKPKPVKAMTSVTPPVSASSSADDAQRAHVAAAAGKGQGKEPAASPASPKSGAKTEEVTAQGGPSVPRASAKAPAVIEGKVTRKGKPPIPMTATEAAAVEASRKAKAADDAAYDALARLTAARTAAAKSKKPVRNLPSGYQPKDVLARVRLQAATLQADRDVVAAEQQVRELMKASEVAYRGRLSAERDAIDEILANELKVIKHVR